MIEYLVLTKNNQRTKNYAFKCSDKKIENFEEEMVIEYFFGEFDFDSLEDKKRKDLEKIKELKEKYPEEFK